MRNEVVSITHYEFRIDFSAAENEIRCERNQEQYPRHVAQKNQVHVNHLRKLSARIVAESHCQISERIRKAHADKPIPPNYFTVGN